MLRPFSLGNSGTGGGIQTVHNGALTTAPQPGGAQNITAAGNTVGSTSSLQEITATGGSVVLTSTPNVAAGTLDGQRLTILNLDTANAVTFASKNTQAGSGILLGAAARIVGIGGHLDLIWSSARAAWVETGFLTAANS